MPLGNNSYNKGNSNGKKNDFSPTTYSNIRISNFDSTVDPTSVSFSFWKGMLRITITPIKKGADGGYSFDKDNSIEVYLTPTRAALFLNYLRQFRKDPNAYVNVGVTAGNSIIYVTNGAEEFEGQDGNGLFLIVKSLDEKGNIDSEIGYQFKTTPDKDNFGIIDYKGGTDFTKDYEYTKFLDYDIFTNTIAQYVNGNSSAVAATVVDATRFSFNSIISKLTSIQENLGIDTGSGYKRKSNASAFFSNNGNESTSSSFGRNSDKIEEVEDYQDLIMDV